MIFKNTNILKGEIFKMKIKRILSILLTLSMVLSLCSFTVAAEDVADPSATKLLTAWNYTNISADSYVAATSAYTWGAASKSLAGESRAISKAITVAVSDSVGAGIKRVDDPVIGSYVEMSKSRMKSNYGVGLVANGHMSADMPVFIYRHSFYIPNDENVDAARYGDLLIGSGSSTAEGYTKASVNVRPYYKTKQLYLAITGVSEDTFSVALDSKYNYTPGTWADVEARIYRTTAGTIVIAGYVVDAAGNLTQIYYAEGTSTSYLNDFYITSLELKSSSKTVSSPYYCKEISFSVGGADYIPEKPDSLKLAEDLAELTLPESGLSITSDLNLPVVGTNGTAFSWLSSNPAVISDAGVVTKPEFDTSVTLTLNASNGNASKTQEYTYTVTGTSLGLSVWNFNDNLKSSGKLNNALAKRATGVNAAYSGLGYDVTYAENDEANDGSVAVVKYPKVGSNFANSGVGAYLTEERPTLSAKYRLNIPAGDFENNYRQGVIILGGGGTMTWRYANGAVSVLSYTGEGSGVIENEYPYTPGTWLEIKALFYQNTTKGNLHVGVYAKSGNETDYSLIYYTETAHTTFTDRTTLTFGKPEIEQYGSTTVYYDCTTYYDYAGVYATAEVPVNPMTDAEKLAADIAAIGLPDNDSAVTENLTLPASGSLYGSTFNWTSSNPAVISDAGVVTKPKDDTPVTLTLNASLNSESVTNTYSYTVSGLSTTITSWLFNIDRLATGSVINNGLYQKTGQLAAATGKISKNFAISSGTTLNSKFDINEGENEFVVSTSSFEDNNRKNGITRFLTNYRESLANYFSSTETALEFSYDVYIDEESKSAYRTNDFYFGGDKKPVGYEDKVDEKADNYSWNEVGVTSTIKNGELSFNADVGYSGERDLTKFRAEIAPVPADVWITVKYLFKITQASDHYVIKAYGIYDGKCYMESEMTVKGTDLAISQIVFDICGMSNKEVVTKYDNFTIKHLPVGYVDNNVYGDWESATYLNHFPVTYNSSTGKVSAGARLVGYNKGSLVVAVYNHDKTVAKVYVDDTFSGDSLTINEDISSYVSKPGTYTVKSFLFEDMNTIKPYAASKSATITVEEVATE